ncbi:hypothetical protein T265_13686 [Opisthorchis viverrini]|uniref:PDZ domain-containing protein n=1 Tax=Opisthorchis viverrini TaxID=6198 RepID=A0A074ZQ81_OPIVI|nr:hypothetical protein T265_13686 [Opisthorchis viverrini]KER27982.1 hypothetical protein T265_13686 [Opisthorchis viverrini]
MESVPHARLCELQKWKDFSGYGFSLKGVKGRVGNSICEVDPDSPAYAGGVRNGDLVVEVNGINVLSEPHMEVVERIKSDPDRVCLLVVDPESRRHFEERHLIVDTHMKHLRHIVCPPSRPGHRLHTNLASHPEIDGVPDIPKRRDLSQSPTTHTDSHTPQRQPPTGAELNEAHGSLEESEVQQTGNNGFLKQPRSEVDIKNFRGNLGRARSAEIVIVSEPTKASTLENVSKGTGERIQKLTIERYSEPLEKPREVTILGDAVERIIRENEDERLVWNEPVRLLGSKSDWNQGKDREKTDKTQICISEIGEFEHLCIPSKKGSFSSICSEKLGHSLRDINEFGKPRAKSFEYSISVTKHNSHKNVLLPRDKQDDGASVKLPELISSVKPGESSRQNSTDLSTGRGALLNGGTPPPMNDRLKIDLDVDLERLKFKLGQNRRKQHTPMKSYTQRKRDFDAL